MEIKRTFIQTRPFTRSWTALGFNDEDLRRLENQLLQNPKIGGSTRVCYVDFEIKETIYLLAVFAKNELENLTKEERNHLKKQIDILESNL